MRFNQSEICQTNKARLHNATWMNQSKRNHRESTIWQRRFLKHQIRDDYDFETHMDYIHFNPVRHGQIDGVCDWPHSTFHRFFRSGVYPITWAGSASKTCNVVCGE